jgi:hypothetical protein
MGKNMSRVSYGAADWWQQSGNSGCDWLKKKPGKIRGRAGKLRFSGSLYQKRIHVNYYSNVRGGGNCEAISDGAGVSL